MKSLSPAVFSSHMTAALEEARAASARGEVPIGAVVVDGSGAIIARSGNRIEELVDPTAHAELLVIREACKVLGNRALTECDLYVTLEPCPMCAQGIAQARLRRLYFGAADPKRGGVEHGPRIFSQPSCHHRPEIYGGLAAEEAARLLRDFFQVRRD